MNVEGQADSNRVVQSLWIGDRLTAMEKLAIGSFLKCGHEFQLYTYSPIEGIPRGVIVRDGNEILPASRIFTYRSGFGQGSYSAFSNFFRYKLLRERGGWWVDTDVVCVRCFDFSDAIVLGTEHIEPGHDRLVVSSSVMKQPRGSALMEWAWRACQQVSLSELTWGEIGPGLMQRGVDELSLHVHLRPPRCFSPIPCFECESFVAQIPPSPFGTEVHAVHLWHQMWHHCGIDPDGRFPDTSLYEQLKRRFLRE